MCDCNSNRITSNPAASSHVPDFSVHGFRREDAKPAHLEGVLALRLSVCVGASLKNGQICFSLPIYGDFCITCPIPIPVNASLKVCAETCGSILPTGVTATLYVNGAPVWSFPVVGSC